MPRARANWPTTSLGIFFKTSASAWGWRASVGLGDARLGQGDLLGAALAWQSVISAAGAPDSLVKLAAHKLNALGAASPNPTEGRTR